MATISIVYRERELISLLEESRKANVAYVEPFLRHLPAHVHLHSYPVFVERRGDASLIRLGLRCACGDITPTDYLRSS